LSDYVTEEQQIEALKRWWKEYGLSIVVGVTLAIVVIFGWRFYQNYETRGAQQASILYTRMTIDVLNNQKQDAVIQAKSLRANFTGTPYAKIAALTLARYAVLQNKLDEAVSQLHWVVKHASSKVLVQLARLRLARIYIVQNKTAEALGLLKHIKDASLAGLVAEAQGDAYTKLGDVNKAQAMYRLALKEIPMPEQNRSILQMKLYD